MRQGKILIDANLLVLLVVGMDSIEKIQRHRRLNGFTREDFGTLVDVVGQYNGIIVTPHTLTETYNLCSYMKGDDRKAAFRNISLIIETSKESFVPGKIIIKDDRFTQLGLVDAMLLRLASKSRGRKPVLLTVDLDLYIAAQVAGYPAVNFNHLRDVED